MAVGVKGAEAFEHALVLAIARRMVAQQERIEQHLIEVGTYNGADLLVCGPTIEKSIRIAMRDK
jgi:hypothetical protein